MDTGEILTRWSVRVAVVLFTASLASRRRSWTLSRWAWTLGWLAYLLHVAAAFHYYHHWSHSDAYAATARQTQEATGLDWGGGVFANYLFTGVWVGDGLWWWVSATTYAKRPRVVSWLILGFLGFIAFNATVVFADGFSRWFGIAACMFLAAMVMLRRKEQQDADATDQGRPGVDGGDDR